MSKKIWLGLALAFPIVWLSVWVGKINYEIKQAPEIVIRAEGYDPRSLIAGQYLYLRLNWQEADCSQFKDNLCHPNRFDYVYQYYIPEDVAPLLDKIVQQGDVKIDLVFAYPENNSPYLKRMLFNGIKWQDWLKQNDKQ